MSNHQRIKIARAALAAACLLRGNLPAELGDAAVIDLLTDIRHFCQYAGLDFERCDRLSALHFEEEHK